MQQVNFKDVPAVGQVWPGQGGINGGLVSARGDMAAHYLIIAAADVGDHEWGGYREESKTTSKTDGKANTEWLCNDETQHPAANACAEYKADGHHDFYLPAAAELYHCWVNCHEVFAQDCYYWSSSQRSASYAFFMAFADGLQLTTGKDGELRVRPVRRLFIQPSDNSDLTVWNGEGLPPVGSRCEYRGAHQYDEWTVIAVFAHWKDQVFVDFGDGWRAERDLSRFRPIRTPDQIAAEEREAAINTMCDLLGTPSCCCCVCFWRVEAMSIEKMREQFEAWVLREYPNQSMGKFSDGEYQSLTVQHCWLSWKASREAVVVELPHGWGYGCINPKTGKPYGASLLNSKLVREAIEAQGLKVVP